MRTLPVSPTAIVEALEVLRAGGIVAHATETCYGLACDLSSTAAVAKLFRIKRRPGTQPVSALFASVEKAKRYVEWNDRAEELTLEHLPGPLTLILPLRTDAPVLLLPTPDPRYPSPTVGIRISPHPVALELVTRFGSPLSTTSANVHGKPNPYSAEDIAAQFRDAADQPDLILDSGRLPPTPPSTVMDLSTTNETVRRLGNIRNPKHEERNQ